MDRQQIIAKRQMLERELANLPKFECATCEQWSSGWCSKYEEKPPEEITIVGCQDWAWDGVPF